MMFSPFSLLNSMSTSLRTAYPDIPLRRYHLNHRRILMMSKMEEMMRRFPGGRRGIIKRIGRMFPLSPSIVIIILNSIPTTDITDKILFLVIEDFIFWAPRDVFAWRDDRRVL